MSTTSEPIQHVTDFADSVLRWTPETLLAEDAYDDDVQALPLLPQTESVSEYKSAYRPAVRAEVYTQLSQALLRPQKLTRPIHWTEVATFQPNRGGEPWGSRSTLLKFEFHRSPELRPKDFVFISTSKQPWEETAALCAPGLVHWEADPVPSDRDAFDRHTACVEVHRTYIDMLVDPFGTKTKLYVIAISSIASGYRILEALGGSGHSELLMTHILHPGPVSDPSLTQIQPHDAAIVYTLSHANEPLNQAQKLAIIAALQPLYKPVRHPILLLRPPGTGKTHTLSSLILAITLARPAQTIHVVAPSNAAVREIAVRLLRDAERTKLLHKSQISIFGNEDSIDTTDGIDKIYFDARARRLRNFETRLFQAKSNLADFYDYVQRDHNDEASVTLTWKWRKEVMDEICVLLTAFRFDLTDQVVTCRSEAKQCSDLLTKWASKFQAGINSFDDTQKHLIDSALPLFKRCQLNRNLLRSSDARPLIYESTKVAFSTVSSAGAKTLQPFFKREPLIILDEATQSVEPEMALLLHQGIKGLIAIGDPMQLPSVVSHRELRSKGFSISLFERLYKAGTPHIMLEIQYRMNPSISVWPSATFYEKRLVDASLARDSRRIPSWQDAKDSITTPYNFVDIPGSENYVESTTSYKNVIEADVIVGYLKDLCQQFAKIGHDGLVEIGCIAGYTEQVDLLNRKISSLLPGARYWQTASRIKRIQLPGTPICMVRVDIASIDAFQGQERDIILFATTRANPKRNIGFLSDPRRLNVALTRARYMLKIFGNSGTLASSPSWNSLIQDAIRRECYEDASDEENSWQITTKQVSAARVNDTVAQIRANGTGPKTSLADGMSTLAEVELKAVGGSKLFAEIQTVIKGSLEVLETGRNLDLEQYLRSWDTRYNTLTVAELRLAYKCFEMYQRLLKEDNEWDLNDAVQSLYSRCTSYPEVCRSFVLETLAVDEVQDMNAASLALLKFLLNGPGACDIIHYAGDAAQVINSAANFRFSDLKDLYFKIYLPHLSKTDPYIARILQSKSDIGRLVPKLKPLTMNYRSVESIVMLGNAVLAWMTAYIPGSIDQLNPDHGLAQGGLPVFLEVMGIQDFLARVVGSAESVDTGNIEFGADQAIIVRNADAKRAVKQLVGQCAIVLDIKECKGLEFDRWRVVDFDDGSKTEFDPLRDQLLLFELKQLYVAVTRARTNLWIYDQSERGAAVRAILQERQLVTTLKKASNGEVPLRLAKRSTPEEWNQAGLRFFSQDCFEEALPCFVRSGNFAKERETRAYIHMKEADQLEGSRSSSAIRKAAHEREQAGNLFRGLGSHRLAAIRYQTAGIAVSSATLLVKAADAWIESGQTESNGHSVLRCLVLAGSPAYTKLLSALEMGWIARNAAYWQSVDTLAERFCEEASDADIGRIASLIRTLEERIQFLDDLGKKEAVENLLRTSGEWERLGLTYEKDGELSKAEEAWRSARRPDVVEKITRSASNLRLWTDWHRTKVESTEESESRTTGSASGVLGNSSNLYFEVLDYLRRSCGLEAMITDAANFTVERVTILLKLVEGVHARFLKFKEFCTHLCSGSFPDPLLAECLGLYRTQHREQIYLVANEQLVKWENLDFSSTVETSCGYRPATCSQVAKVLGEYCKEATKALERSVFSLACRSESWSDDSTDAGTHFQLKLNAASAYGNHMVKFCVPNIVKLDEFILKWDRLIYPFGSGPESRVMSLNWINKAENQAFIEQIITHRRQSREEADSNVVVTSLRWSCARGVVSALPPSDLPLNNLVEALGWSTLTPSKALQPLAESVLRLDKFFAVWAPQLMPHKEITVESQTVPNWDASIMPVVRKPVTAKSQLWVLERLFFAIICLTDRFYETALPTRLLESEMTRGAQSQAVLGLLQRKPDSTMYLDNTGYWKGEEFLRIRENLRTYLLDFLVNQKRLVNILETFQSAERAVYIKRVITLTICLHCSGNLNSSPTRANPKQDLFELHGLLQRLSRDLPCEEVRPILARTLGTERGIGPCIQNLTRLSEALGDPIQAVIDPLKWTGKEGSLGTKARKAIPKTFIREFNGALEVSETSDFGVVDGGSLRNETAAPGDDDGEEETEASEHEGEVFRASERTLEEMEAETKAALNHPLVRKYLTKWIERYRHRQVATKHLIATDKIAILRIVKQGLDYELRHVLLREVCPALSQVNLSYFEKGNALLLDSGKNRTIFKAVLTAGGKGSPNAWLKDFRPALEGLEYAFDALRARLGHENQIKDELVEIAEQSRQLVDTAKQFDKEYKGIIEAFYKKKATKSP